MIASFFRHKKYRLLLLFLLIILSGLIFISPLYVDHFANPKIYSAAEVPAKRVAIVFGAAVWSNETPSDMLTDRLKVAAGLYHQGKISKILLSGDNSLAEYNEPEVMKKYILSLGVSADNIQLDYAGFRTYDTCQRANKVFGLDEAMLVTQTAHLQRAIFLCERAGIESVGVPADLREYATKDQQIVREWLAKISAFGEGYIFRHQPKFLGEQIPI